jgi:predicted RNase H-like HicB family nuclease
MLCEENAMRVKVRIYDAEEGGYWAVIPGIPNCVSEGETVDEVTRNIAEALQALASVEEYGPERDQPGRLVDIDV